MSDTYQYLVKKALDLGALDARLIDTQSIVFDHRSFLKCRFGCNRWGRYWTCPPHMSISPETFMEAYAKYSKALIIQTADPQKGQDVTLAIEKEAMLTGNSPFAFAMVLCVQCETCAYPEPCLSPIWPDRPWMPTESISGLRWRRWGSRWNSTRRDVCCRPGTAWSWWRDMAIGILCCQVMEREVRSLIRAHPDAFRLEILEWGLHIHPPLLLNRLGEDSRP